MSASHDDQRPGTALPSGTVTFLFTDIEGSTALLKALGDDYATVLTDHRRILRELFLEWNGREVDTQGDAFFVSFPRATQAAAASVAIQRALAEHPWPKDADVTVRMGLHTGEPLVAEAGYVGMDVHRAARIAQVGHGGQVLLSETTTSLILDELPDGVSLVDLGRHLLKDVSRPEHIRQLAIEGLPSEFPPLTSVEKLPSIELREQRQVGESPYQGLAAFREENAAFFFGREDFTEKLTEAVEIHPLIAVIVGSSGSGKSSAVFAGLIPQLQKKKGWSIAQFRPGSQPLNALITALLPALEPELSPADRLLEARKLADAVRMGELPLYDVVNQALEKHAEVERLLLVVDQFEELYTLCQDEQERVRFKDELLDVVLATSGKRQKRFVLLLTLRADFMGQALTHRPFADALQEASLLMGPMTRDELRAAVEKPAEMQGAAFEPGLVERILDDVGEKPGNLPLLEFALTLLWEAQSNGWLIHEDYESIGCVEGALARYADEVFEGLEKIDQEQARRIFVQLVKPGEGTEDTRRVATRAELPEADWGLVQHLADKRLVVTGRNPDGNDTVEVVHEALIQRWGQFQRWMQADREFRSWQERLRTSVRIWEASEREAGALLRGLPLTEAERWVDERVDELSPIERDYIQISLAEREGRGKAEQARQAREVRLERTRRTLARGLIGVLGVGLAVALGLTFYAFGQRNEAQQSAAIALAEADARATAEQEALGEAQARATAQADAEAQRHDALLQASIGLSSQAALELQGRSPERAVPLALEALENYPYTWQAERALGEAVFNNHLKLILEHHAWVNSALWSPDETRILTASDDQTAKVWDATTGEPLFTFEHEEWVPRALWSPLGGRILTHAGGDEGHNAVLNVWDGKTGALIRSIIMGGEEGFYFDSDWSPDGTQVLVSRRDGNTRVWDVTTGELVFTFDANRASSDGLQTHAWSPTGSHILTRDTEGGVQIWDAVSGEAVHLFRGHSDYVGSAVWSPNGDRVLSASDDGTIKIWDAIEGVEVLSWMGGSNLIYSALWSPSGAHILSLGDDGIVRVWDAKTGKEIVWFDNNVWMAAWSPSGLHIVTAGVDGTTKIWAPLTGKLVQTFFGGNSAVTSANWSRDGKNILTAGKDGSIRVWSLTNETEELHIEGTQEASSHLSWSPDGNRLARMFEDGSVEIYNTLSGSTIIRFRAHESRINVLEFSPSGIYIATTSEDGTAKVWNTETGQLISTFIGHEIPPASVDWSPDGNHIATAVPGSKDSTVRIWDTMSGEERLVFTGHLRSEFGSWGVNWARWSPDGTRIASVGKFGDALIWDVSTGEVLLSLYPEGNRFQVTSLTWSPDGRKVATHADDGILRIWDALTGEQLISTTGHSATLRLMDWHPTADRILSGDIDGVFKMFDTQTGSEVFSVKVPSYGDLQLSPEGTRFATSSSPSGPIKIFSIWGSTEELIALARDCCLVRDLTPEEREKFGLPPVDTTDQ